LIFSRFFFLGFELRPILEHLLGCIRLHVAKNVRVAANHLVADAGDHVEDVESARLPGEVRVKEHLKKQIAQFLGQFRAAALLDGVEDLIGLLDKIRAEGEVCLFAIPRAAARSAEAELNGNELVEELSYARRGRFRCFLCRPWLSARRLRRGLGGRRFALLAFFPIGSSGGHDRCWLLDEEKTYGTREHFSRGMRARLNVFRLGESPLGARALEARKGAMLNCSFNHRFALNRPRETPLSDSKQDESFKVVDRRLFTAEGELRKDIAEQQDREREPVPAAPKSAPRGAAAPSNAEKAAPAPVEPPADAPKRSTVFENLVRSLGQNAAMLLGGYADPRTGQPMLDLEGAREMIDMLDALRDKTRGNLAPEEDTLLLDVLGNLKLAFMEMAKAAAKQQEKAQTRP
jgi:hypothetical protein